ncbi:MAG TPA: hypothetical protein VN974_07945 [Candidatus Dormibacteraeota bacterium]|jgi:hypothetical protein|nr:hypothetical protein [Candidatus Dormibacteraeota bacterium]
MKTKTLRYWTLATVVFLLACSSIQAGEHKYQHGVMIDTAEYDWCHHDCASFDRPTFFFCVQVADQVLIGSRKADWRWMYDSSQMLSFKGKQVSIRFDDDSIWIIRTDSKEMHLSSDYSQDVFERPEYTAEVHRRWLRQFEALNRPATVPPEAVLIPQGAHPLFKSQGPHFWVKCSVDTQANWDLCEIWNEKGIKYKEVKCVSSSDKLVPAADLLVDQLTTKVDYEIHLKNGTVLKVLR